MLGPVRQVHRALLLLTTALAGTTAGGWARGKRGAVREESDAERTARIHAERVRMGILPPDPEIPAALERAGGTIAGGAATPLSPQARGFDTGAALAEELAKLHTSAYLDMEIARHFRILEDEEDAALLMVAIALVH
ncbi:MAG: hypothetical protein ACREVW_02255 [Burkholderiales bacterium]